MQDQDPVTPNGVRQLAQLRRRLAMPTGGDDLEQEPLLREALGVALLGDLLGREARVVAVEMEIGTGPAAWGRGGWEDGVVWFREPGRWEEVCCCVGYCAVEAVAGGEDWVVSLGCCLLLCWVM